MKKWAFLLGAAAAMSVAAVVVGVAIRRRRAEADNQIPAVIEDCFERIQRLESELQRLRTGPALPA